MSRVLLVQLYPIIRQLDLSTNPGIPAAAQECIRSINARLEGMQAAGAHPPPSVANGMPSPGAQRLDSPASFAFCPSAPAAAPGSAGGSRGTAARPGSPGSSFAFQDDEVIDSEGQGSQGTAGAGSRAASSAARPASLAHQATDSSAAAAAGGASAGNSPAAPFRGFAAALEDAMRSQCSPRSTSAGGSAAQSQSGHSTPSVRPAAGQTPVRTLQRMHGLYGSISSIR